MAESSQQFEQAAAPYTVSFDSVFDKWSFDASCDVSLTSINIVFQLRNSTGFAGYAVAAEDPGATRVVSAALQLHDPRAQTLIYNPTWSGYEFTGNADQTTKVYEAIADWSIPNISQPSFGACESSIGCALAVWPGLSHDQGGGCSTCTDHGIAQTGSLSTLYCSSAACGIPFAQLWYEFWNQEPHAILCDNYSSIGDSIQAYVLNQGYNGGSTALWNLQITDNTIRQSCTVTSYSDNFGVPLLAEFITERPEYGATYAQLPNFNQFSMTGNMYYSGSVTGIYTPYSNGWYYLDVMEACGSPPPNITTGNVNSANTFTQTYGNSNCT